MVPRRRDGYAHAATTNRLLLPLALLLLAGLLQSTSKAEPQQVAVDRDPVLVEFFASQGGFTFLRRIGS